MYVCTGIYIAITCTYLCMVFLYIGFILVPFAVLIMILVSHIIVELLLMIYLIFCINQDDKIVKIGIAGVEISISVDATLPMLRGPGDRPLKRDYLLTNIQPFSSVGRNLVSHKFHGGVAEADNCRVMIKDLPYSAVPTTDKLSTTSSGYFTATSPKISSNTIEDNDVPSNGISPLDEGELNSKAKSVVSGYGHSKYPVLIGNTVVVCDTKTFASLPQHCKYMVKVKVKDTSGSYKIKMALKSTSDTER